MDFSIPFNYFPLFQGPFINSAWHLISSLILTYISIQFHLLPLLNINLALKPYRILVTQTYLSALYIYIFAHAILGYISRMPTMLFFPLLPVNCLYPFIYPSNLSSQLCETVPALPKMLVILSLQLIHAILQVIYAILQLIHTILHIILNISQ